jgi:DNA recombination protein RmuC
MVIAATIGIALIIVGALIVMIMRANKEWMRNSAELLRKEFSLMASQAIEEKNSHLVNGNALIVKPLFEQMKERLEEFKTATENAQKENIAINSALRSQIEVLGRNATSLGKQAEDFITALKSGNKIKGNWGEGIVKNTLEAIGLQENKDYKCQTGSEGVGIVDFIISDGTGRKILIDSKVNIDAFIEASNAYESGCHDEAKLLFKKHAEKVKAQIINLSSKNYPQNLEKSNPGCIYSPIVIMAMPSEATYAAAISADPTLCSFAYSNNIVLASPQMLYGYMVLFKLGLDKIQINRNHDEIFKRVTQVIERMDAACECLEKIGQNLENAKKSYDDAIKKFTGEKGAHSVLSAAKELQRLSRLSLKKQKSEMMDISKIEE